MEKYICTICEYVYDPELGDPENGIEPGTSFEDLPADWVCPLCGVYYMDIIAECEKLGDYVVNVVEASSDIKEKKAS